MSAIRAANSEASPPSLKREETCCKRVSRIAVGALVLTGKALQEVCELAFDLVVIVTFPMPLYFLERVMGTPSVDKKRAAEEAALSFPGSSSSSVTDRYSSSNP